MTKPSNRTPAGSSSSQRTESPSESEYSKDQRPIREACIALGFLTIGFAGGLLVNIRPQDVRPAATDPDHRPEAGSQMSGSATTAACYWGVALRGESTTVLADVDGRVEDLMVRLGDAVSAGTVLARIDARTPRKEVAIAEAALRAAIADEHRAKNDVSQATDLRDRLQRLGAVAPEEERMNAEHRWRSRTDELARAQAFVAEQRARLEQTRLGLSKTVVTAPISGAVAERFVNPGALLTRGSPMFVIVGKGVPFIRFGVPPTDAAHIRVGARLIVTPEASVSSLTGQVTQISPEIDSASRLVHMEASLAPTQQSPHLAHGMTVCARSALAIGGEAR